MSRGGCFAASGSPIGAGSHVEILPLAEIPEKPFLPPRPPRALRSHHRWSWHDRLACNVWWGPPLLRITVAGVPAFLAVSER